LRLLVDERRAAAPDASLNRFRGMLRMAKRRRSSAWVSKSASTKNFDGLVAGVDFDADGRIAEIDFVSATIATASQKPYGSRKRAFLLRPHRDTPSNGESRISGHMTGLRRGFEICRHPRHLRDRHRSLISAFHTR
jgi:hypothetical protein